MNTRSEPVPLSDTSLRADLEHVAKQRIFFGHQSVGGNLLDGMQQLATKAGVPLRLQETKTAAGVQPASLGHTFIGENGNPAGKLQSFERTMGSGAQGLDIALVKFCYVDFSADTDVKTLFSKYRATIDTLRSRNPNVSFVHVTAPLTDTQTGIKAFIKGLLGRAPYGVLENLRREEYNTLLRQTYAGREPLFDLARFESTTPDGVAVKTIWKGTSIPAMAPIYTDDGGHLNATGRLLAARELISILATIPAH